MTDEDGLYLPHTTITDWKHHLNSALASHSIPPHEHTPLPPPADLASPQSSLRTASLPPRYCPSEPASQPRETAIFATAPTKRPPSSAHERPRRPFEITPQQSQNRRPSSRKNPCTSFLFSRGPDPYFHRTFKQAVYVRVYSEVPTKSPDLSPRLLFCGL